MRTESSICAETGRLARPDCDTDLSTLPFHPHPKYPGVALRHLVTGVDTGGALSAHLVRIMAGSCLEEHVHPDSLEVHAVVRGAGACSLAGRPVRYEPGVHGLIPAGTGHSVRADAGEDLYILAMFAPALL